MNQVELHVRSEARCEQPQEIGAAMRLMANPVAGVMAMSALGFGIAGHILGLWAGAVAGAAQASQRLVSGQAAGAGGAEVKAELSVTLERAKLHQWLNFISTELHKGFSPLFNAKMPAEGKEVLREKLLERIKFVDGHLAKNPYIMGREFTVADAYAFTVLSWTKPMKIDLKPFPHVRAYLERVAARPAVQEAQRAEGMIK